MAGNPTLPMKQHREGSGTRVKSAGKGWASRRDTPMAALLDILLRQHARGALIQLFRAADVFEAG